MNHKSHAQSNRCKMIFYGLNLFFLLSSPGFLSAQETLKNKVIILTDVENEPDDT